MNAHPAADLFPMMDAERLAELAEDISAHGLRDPIVTFEGKILDGRNRKRACEMVGVAPRFAEWQDDGGGPTAYVLSENLKRRDLTPGQRAAIAVEALPLFEAEARERQAHGMTAPGRTLPAIAPEARGEARQFAADKTGASARYVQEAKAIKAADPDLFDKVKAGEVELLTASRRLGRTPSGSSGGAKARTKKPGTDREAFAAIMRDLSRLRERWDDATFAGLPRGDAERLLKTLGENPEFLLHLRQLLERRARKLVLAGLSS